MLSIVGRLRMDADLQPENVYEEQACGACLLLGAITKSSDDRRHYADVFGGLDGSFDNDAANV